MAGGRSIELGMCSGFAPNRNRMTSSAAVEAVVNQGVWDTEALPPRDESFELTFDGGDTLRLEGATGVWATESNLDYGPTCFEANGRWRGAAGELEGRTGRFTIAYDSVQTILRLVED